MNVVRNVKRNILKGVLIANKLNRRRNKMSDEEVRNRTYIVLKYFSDKLTPEQLDYCVRKLPATARTFCYNKLTPEQKQYCEEKTK